MNVEIRLEASGRMPREVHLGGCQFWFLVEDLAGERIYSGQPSICPAIIVHLYLNPGDSIAFAFTWSQVDNEGQPVPREVRYRIVGELHTSQSPPLTLVRAEVYLA